MPWSHRSSAHADCRLASTWSQGKSCRQAGVSHRRLLTPIERSPAPAGAALAGEPVARSWQERAVERGHGGNSANVQRLSSRSSRHSRLVATARHRLSSAKQCLLDAASLNGGLLPHRQARRWQVNPLLGAGRGGWLTAGTAALCHARQMFVRREDIDPEDTSSEEPTHIGSGCCTSGSARLDCRCHRKKRATTRELRLC